MATAPKRMAEAAAGLLASLNPEQVRAATAPLDTPDRRQWTYLPGPRPGLCLVDMAPDQQRRALELLESSATDEGAGVVRGAIEIERVRRELATGQPVPDGDRYWFRVLGDPGDDHWEWRVNGHHLAVHVTIAGDRISVTPHFVGSEPATVPYGPQAGRQLLAPEEELARDLLASLTTGQRGAAIVAAEAPDDILTRADPVADPTALPTGVRYGDLDLSQQATLRSLIDRYLSRAPSAYVETCWAEIRAAGIDGTAFAWAGSEQPGQGHYYCVTGPTFLIEYDNTQDNANHAHSVWRHLRDDWGEDLLRRHYAQAH